jgi:hypothetical protein
VGIYKHRDNFAVPVTFTFIDPTHLRGLRFHHLLFLLIFRGLMFHLSVSVECKKLL